MNPENELLHNARAFSERERYRAGDEVVAFGAFVVAIVLILAWMYVGI